MPRPTAVEPKPLPVAGRLETVTEASTPAFAPVPGAPPLPAIVPVDPPVRPGDRPTDRSGETTAAGVPWLVFARHRAAVGERWADHWRLPVDRRLFGPLERHGILDGTRNVLDVGATDRRHAATLRTGRPGLDYRSLDVDRTLPHDYHDFSEIDRTFDLVVCLEVLEHVDEATALRIVRGCADACRPGGHVFVTVPNRLVPEAQFEFTHRSCFSALDLGGLLRLAGLEIVDLARGTRGSWRRWHRLHARLGAWHRFMRTDWTASVTCLARRPEPAA